MNLRNIPYLKFLISIIILGIFPSCKSEGNTNYKNSEIAKENEKTSIRFEKLYNLTMKEFEKDITAYNYIFFFNNKGCKPCNEHYFNQLNNNTFSKDVLIIYSGGKHSFNYNQINLLRENQLIDEYEVYNKLGYLNVSSIIKLNRNIIDTIYNVDATFNEYEEIITKKVLLPFLWVKI